MQDIFYNVKRSSFYQHLEEAVRRSDRLSTPIQMELGKGGGYARDVQIEIGDDLRAFRSDWPGAERRFSARLRALATVLRDHGIHGRFHAVHSDGTLTLERVDAEAH